jgi:NADH:ubiquinone oxidoreductase subunit C
MSTAPSTSEQELVFAIKEQLGTAVENVATVDRGRILVVARKETARDVAVCLQRFGFDHTLAVSGVDHPWENHLDVVYFLSSYSHAELKHVVVSLKIHLERENPSSPSLTPIWESANMFERETYEMFGVNFEGHPNLEKLLLQDNWDGPPPLKKDLKIPELA